MENSDATTFDAQSDEVTRLKAEMPEVYDYIVRYLEERSSPNGGWHSEFAYDVFDHFDISWDSFDVIARCIRELTYDTYGTLYPGRAAAGSPG